jgi:hypothetical protein
MITNVGTLAVLALVLFAIMRTYRSTSAVLALAFYTVMNT